MIEAFLHGKLSRQQENMEDMLTSCVFGTLRMLPPSAGLLPWLTAANFGSESQEWRRRLSELAAIDASLDLDFEFWPTLRYADCYGCEPDLIISSQSKRLVILIEAKLFSGKSSFADDSPFPMDQLAREWDNLYFRSKDTDASPWLVYLTADLSYPSADIEAAINEYSEKRPGQMPPRIGWLSWDQFIASGPDSDTYPAISRVKSLIQRLDLSPFQGYPAVSSVPSYQFEVTEMLYNWGFDVCFPSFDWTWSES